MLHQKIMSLDYVLTGFNYFTEYYVMAQNAFPFQLYNKTIPSHPLFQAATEAVNVPTSPGPAPAQSPPQSEAGDALPRYKRDLAAKAKVLRAELQALQPQNGHCRIEVI